MKVFKDVCQAGRTIDVTIKVASGSHGGTRKPKMNITSEKVQRNNDRLAVKELTRKLNANFVPGDLHVVLTYETAPEKLQAKKDRETFVRKLRKEMEIQGKELKYVAVTEYEHTRIHHHLVINAVELSTLEKLWVKGWVKATVLDESGQYSKLAEYLIKETQKTFREEGSIYKRRYSCSGNLIKPVVTRIEVDLSELFEDPQPEEGYYIDFERRYEHPITGIEHLEYMMVTDGQPRNLSWLAGKTISGREYFKINYEEEQISLGV